jgi:6-phosphogluconolactonase
MPEIRIHPDRESLVRAATELIIDAAATAIGERGAFRLALAGGETPEPVYARLAQTDQARQIDWARVELFFGDERCVAPDDPRSNYHMVRTTLLERVQIPADHVHRIRGEDEPALAAAAYEVLLARRLKAQVATLPPRLDLVLLGMGEDGHTASLFPGTASVSEETRWVVAHFVDSQHMWRITLTPVVLNAARSVVFLVSGGRKAEMLRQVIEGAHDPERWPAQVVRPTHGVVHWLLDSAAARRLRPAA